MRLFEIFQYIKEYFVIGMIIALIVIALFCVGYFVIYRKLMSGKKKINGGKLLIGTLLLCYICMVVGVTFLNRGSYHGMMKGDINPLFSAYKSAWNTWYLREWQGIILNIVMFMPLGFLLPLLNKKLKKSYYTIGIGFLFTCIIEMIQWITGRGIFEFDDIFNNTLGTIIGYSLVMIIITCVQKNSNKIKKVLIYSIPIICAVGAFGSILVAYNLKDYGNLNSTYIKKTSMSKADIQLNVELSNSEKEAYVYQAPSLSKEEAKEKIEYIFESIGTTTGERKDVYSQDMLVYDVTGDKSIWLKYVGGSYQFTDFTQFDDGVTLMDTTREVLVDKLKEFGIIIPDSFELVHSDIGMYEFIKADDKELSDLLIGSVKCSYYSDNTIKSVDNDLVTLEPVKKELIISEEAAFNEVKTGKFRFYDEEKSLKSLIIDDVRLTYQLDTKGFYQPIYVFDVILNGSENGIVINALK